jgi:flagellar M-ring protein FliF
MVAAAVGLQQNRGDQINVSAMPFDTSYLDQFREEGPPAPVVPAVLKKYWPAAAGAAGLLVLLLLLILFIRRRRRGYVEEIEEEVPQAPVAAAYEPGPEQPAEQPSRTQRIREMARERPAEVAEILKLWLKE